MKNLLIVFLFFICINSYGSVDTLYNKPLPTPSIITAYSYYIDKSINVTYTDSAIHVIYNFILPNDIEVRIYADDKTLVFDREFSDITQDYLTIARVWRTMYIVIIDKDFMDSQIIFIIQ